MFKAEKVWNFIVRLILYLLTERERYFIVLLSVDCPDFWVKVVITGEGGSYSNNILVCLEMLG